MKSTETIVAVAACSFTVLCFNSVGFTQQFIGSCSLYYAQSVCTSGSYAFVANPWSFYSVDMTDVTVPHIIDSLECYSGFPHIFIHKNYAYLTGFTNGLNIIDISNPDSLSLISEYDPVSIGGFVHCSFIRNDIAYLALCEGIVILNVADKFHPFELGRKRFGGDSRAIWIDENLAFMPNCTLPQFFVLDISNVNRPETLSYSTITPANSWYPSSHDNYVYAPSYRKVKVIDVANPRHPFAVDSLGGFGKAITAFVFDDNLLIADEDSGLFIYNISNAAHPALTGRYLTHCRSVCASERYIYLAGRDQLEILEYDTTPVYTDKSVTSGNHITMRVTLNPFNSATRLAVEGFDRGIIQIYDVNGRHITDLETYHGETTWHPGEYSSGLYFARATANGYVSNTIKLIYIK